MIKFHRQHPVVVRLRESPQLDKPPPLSTIIKDEIILISFLVLFVGIVSTDAYYSSFGVRYQFLSLQSQHIVYRGLTILVHAPYLLLPYLVGALWLWLDTLALQRASLLRFRSWRNPLAYFFIFILLILTFFMARYAGITRAATDMRADTSTLPEVVTLKVDDEATETVDGEAQSLGDQSFRLLLVDSDYVILFTPLKPQDRAALPNIKRISKGDVHVIETNR